jgi:predicted HicB family RNase H-like nuclease
MAEQSPAEKQPVNLRMDKKLWGRLREQARLEKRSLRSLVEDAVRRYLKTLQTKTED